MKFQRLPIVETAFIYARDLVASVCRLPTNATLKMISDSTSCPMAWTESTVPCTIHGMRPRIDHRPLTSQAQRSLGSITTPRLFPLILQLPLLLFLPMTTLLIVLTDPQRSPQLLALLNLRLRQLMHLMRFQVLRVRPTARTRLFGFKLLA